MLRLTACCLNSHIRLTAEVHPTGGSSEHVASRCYKFLKVKVNHKFPPSIHVVISKYQMDLDTSQVSSLGHDAPQDQHNIGRGDGFGTRFPKIQWQ